MKSLVYLSIKSIWLWLFFLSILGRPLSYGQVSSNPHINSSTLIKNISYFDVHSRTFNKADILIEEGVIKQIKNEIKPLDNFFIVDGTDKYLIPGLIDAHIHMFQSGGLYTRPDAINLTQIKSYNDEITWINNNIEDILKRYLSIGVTTVIDVGGPFRNFAIRDSFIKRNDLPRIVLTGPLISTYQPPEFLISDPPIIKVKTSLEAVDLVKKQIPFKPDFIKIWYITLPGQTAESTYDIVKATINESHNNNLKVAVHATELNTAKLAIKAGADILVHSVGNPIDEEFIAMLKKNKVSYIPTLVVHGNYDKVFGRLCNFQNYDITIANPITLGSLMDTDNQELLEVFDQYEKYIASMYPMTLKKDSIRRDNLAMLANNNVNIATGTDAGNIGTLHASSYYSELETMKLSGMSNEDILMSSTYNGAKSIGKERIIGSIEKGMLADLVILNNNPLDDITNLFNINMVFKQGELHEPKTLICNSRENIAQFLLNCINTNKLELGKHLFKTEKTYYKWAQFFSSELERIPQLHFQLVDREIIKSVVRDKIKILGGDKSNELTVILNIQEGKITKMEVR